MTSDPSNAAEVAEPAVRVPRGIASEMSGSTSRPTSSPVPRGVQRELPGALPPGRPVWVLRGARHGDNRQLVAIAEALGLPFRTVDLRFDAPAVLSTPRAWLGARRFGWHSDPPLGPPWPRLVLAAGRRSVAAAQWIRGCSGGATRLVHLNRPWAPIAGFDLVVTTPQYGVPVAPQVLHNLLPFALPPAADEPLPAAFDAAAAGLPRPWTLVLVGGDSRPYVLDAGVAVDLALRIGAEVRAHGGSAWVLDGPRTPAGVVNLVADRLEVPAQAVRWGAGANPYRALLRLADRIVVTADSASMLAEALVGGRPVTLAALPMRPDWRWRVAAAWRRASERAPGSLVGRGYAAAVDRGLVTSVRDLSRWHRALADAGLLADPAAAVAWAARERAATLERIRRLLAAS